MSTQDTPHGFLIPQPITLTQQAQSVMAGTIEAPSTIEQVCGTAPGRVMIQQPDGTQQQATILTSGSVSQNAVLNIPNVPTVVTMPMVSNGSLGTTSNVSSSCTPTNVTSAATPMTTNTITAQQVTQGKKLLPMLCCVRQGSISSELLMCGEGVRSILLLPLVARCLETIDVCIRRMLVFMSVVVIVWGSVGMFVV